MPINSTRVVFLGLLHSLQRSFLGLLVLPLLGYRLVEHLAEHTVAFSDQKHTLELVIQHSRLVHDVLAGLESANLQHGLKKKKNITTQQSA